MDRFIQYAHRLELTGESLRKINQKNQTTQLEITNEIIKVINRHYNANIPFVYAPSFPGATVLGSN